MIFRVAVDNGESSWDLTSALARLQSLKSFVCVPQDCAFPPTDVSVLKRARRNHKPEASP